MTTPPKDIFKMLGTCYYFSLALNALALITIGAYEFIIYYSQGKDSFKIMAEFLSRFQFFFLIAMFYLFFCLILNLAAGICFNNSKNPKLLVYIVIANFLCVPFGTMISIFTLNIFKKLGQKPFYIPPTNTK